MIIKCKDTNQFKNRIISRCVSLFNKNNTMLIYGPQRTFTNFFSQLFERNIYVNQLKGNLNKNINFYKHNPSPTIDNYIKTKPIVFIIYKELNLWIKSLKKNPEDFFIINKKFNYNISSISEVKKLTEYHYNFYTFWIRNSHLVDKLEFVNFRDMLEEDKILKYLEHIKNKYHLHTTSKFFIPKEVRFSDKFDKKKYLLHELERSDLDNEINLLVKKNNI